jgi:hypothetical protein
MARSARAQTVMTRYSTASPEGKEMLKTYNRAIKVMRERPAGHPTSWTFQWYTHAVQGDSDKPAQMNMIYADDDQYRSMAQAMWNTCQGHHGVPEGFATWHRAYVLFFEHIVREAAGTDEFTLPYWPYELQEQRAIPAQFRMQCADDYCHLYIGNRLSNQTPTINDGGSVEISGGVLDFKCLQEAKFCKFSGILDSRPHGQIHDGVGDNHNMSAVEWAARDPVFWVHHSQVDRIWASWNAAGGRNPTDPSFLSTQYIFARPDGTAVVITNEDMLDITALGYDYQTLIPTDPIPPIEGPIAALCPDKNKHLASEQNVNASINLGAAPVTVNVNVTETSDGLDGGQVMRSLAVKSAETGSSIYLSFTGMMAQTTVGTSLNVYLGLPAGATPSPDSPYYAGVLHYFNHTHRHGINHSVENSRPYLINVTDIVRRIQRLELITSDVSVTMVPSKPHAVRGAPMIKSIELISD